MQQFSRPQAAREIEARARAKTMRVRVNVVEPGHIYRAKSQSDPGAVHTISREGDGWHCTCKGFRFSGCCYHIAQVQRRSEREGWSFGRVAPRPYYAA